MKITNLDRFQVSKQVSIGGATYSVRAMTTKEFIDGKLTDPIDQAKNEKEKAKAIVEALTFLTDIPEDTLYGLTLQALMAILLVSQGKDLDEPEDSEKNA